MGSIRRAFRGYQLSFVTEKIFIVGSMVMTPGFATLTSISERFSIRWIN